MVKKKAHISALIWQKITSEYVWIVHSSISQYYKIWKIFYHEILNQKMKQMQFFHQVLFITKTKISA